MLPIRLSNWILNIQFPRIFLEPSAAIMVMAGLFSQFLPTLQMCSPKAAICRFFRALLKVPRSKVALIPLSQRKRR